MVVLPNSNDDTFITKRITNQHIYLKLECIEEKQDEQNGAVKMNRLLIKGNWVAISALAAGFLFLVKVALG